MYKKTSCSWNQIPSYNLITCLPSTIDTTVIPHNESFLYPSIATTCIINTSLYQLCTENSWIIFLPKTNKPSDFLSNLISYSEYYPHYPTQYKHSEIEPPSSIRSSSIRYDPWPFSFFSPEDGWSRFLRTSLLYTELHAANQRGPWPPHPWGGNTVGMTPLDEWSVRRRDLYLTTHNTHRDRNPSPARFEPTVSASKRPHTQAFDSAATGIEV